jgi:hypothetical protein
MTFPSSRSKLPLQIRAKHAQVLDFKPTHILSQTITNLIEHEQISLDICDEKRPTHFQVVFGIFNLDYLIPSCRAYWFVISGHTNKSQSTFSPKHLRTKRLTEHLSPFRDGLKGEKCANVNDIYRNLIKGFGV